MLIVAQFHRGQSRGHLLASGQINMRKVDGWQTPRTTSQRYRPRAARSALVVSRIFRSARRETGNE
jgi:hypothetical protein